MMNEIRSFRPFLAVYESYLGDKMVSVRFTCPCCGSHNVKPRKDLHFFQGHFSCGECGFSKADDGYPFNYYSSCFQKIYEPILIQLSLWDN